MKGIHILLGALLFYHTVASVVGDEAASSISLHTVEATVGQLLEQDHYTQRKLDSNLAKEVLQSYLKSLDYNKLFFTEEDIDQIRNKYSSGLSDDIMLGNLTPARDIYEIFKQRVHQRVANINRFLTQNYDFSSNRTITADRAKEPWPANASEADKIWRDWIENELLEEKLSRSPTEPGLEVVSRYYRELQDRIDCQDDEHVLRIFLEAVAQTYDPHSEYLGPTELNEFKIDTRLTISGIGVQTHMKNGYATIDRIFAGGAAERSGKVHVGDVIVGVAQGGGPFVSTAHTDSDRIAKMVLGKDGSVVRLQLIPGNRKDQSKRRVVTLVRRDVRLTEEEAQAQLIERPMEHGSVQKLGWITVPCFYGGFDDRIKAPSVTEDVATLLKRLGQEGIQGVVIDLRNNGGGSVDEAVRMSGLFIKPGPIAQLRDPNGAIHLLIGQRVGALYNGPMVVLNNKLTASASEIFSAAMQDYGRAVIVGDSVSFGKGTVQAVIDLNGFLHRLDDGVDSAGALKITIEKVYRVSGESTQLKGVISDVRIPSLTDIEEFGESEQEYPLVYDQVPPIANEAARNHKPLFLDELRNWSLKRINEDPIFHDLSAEIQQIKRKLWDNCVSLNEGARRHEMAERACIRDKAESDRSTARAHDQTRYYRLTLADVDKAKLKLRRNTNPEAVQKHAVADETTQCSNSVLPNIRWDNDLEIATANEAIARETLHILSDLVNLERTPLMATRTQSP
jgi:carboxyl-terminal processing protease